VRNSHCRPFLDTFPATVMSNVCQCRGDGQQAGGVLEQPREGQRVQRGHGAHARHIRNVHGILLPARRAPHARSAISFTCFRINHATTIPAISMIRDPCQKTEPPALSRKCMRRWSALLSGDAYFSGRRSLHAVCTVREVSSGPEPQALHGHTWRPECVWLRLQLGL
jgi:hypothetical protein